MPPVISSIDYSPDGTLIALAGYHEVPLHHADGSIRRPLGWVILERAEGEVFYTMAKASSGRCGLPARSGEIQIWNVGSKQLSMSIPVGFDTLYGISWSPDNKKVAVGLGLDASGV